MAKVKKIRKKLRIKRFLIFLLIIGIFGVILYSVMDIPINNIVVKGNDLLTEQEVIELAKLKDDSSFIKTSTLLTKKRLLKSSLIKDAKVHKKLLNNLEIIIKEKKALYLKESDNIVILEDKSETENNNYSVPILVGDIPFNKYNSFIRQMKKIDTSVLREVSEIYYKPTNIDEDRFLLSMTDGNYVYLTLTKFNYLNYYDEMLPEFNGKKGVLYLDSGNTFQIKE